MHKPRSLLWSLPCRTDALSSILLARTSRSPHSGPAAGNIHLATPRRTTIPPPRTKHTLHSAQPAIPPNRCPRTTPCPRRRKRSQHSIWATVRFTTHTFRRRTDGHPCPCRSMARTGWIAIMGPPNAVAPRSHSYSHSHSSSQGIPHSPSLPYSQGQAMANPYGGTPLSSSPQASSAMSNMTTAQYASQAAYAQQVNSQYPASPPRPFACDMCALSFNRQHDLKRHRDTHTGEKPFFCNGGCGKTFTRKDALKRHQVRVPPRSMLHSCADDRNSS